VPPCVEYGLTDLGVTLCEPVGAIRAWAEKYGEAILTARQRYERSEPAGSEPAG
jgi:DNA-binding HxlR family transcriptional regulator